MDWFAQVAPVLFQATTDPNVRRRAAVRERWTRRYGAEHLL